MEVSVKLRADQIPLHLRRFFWPEKGEGGVSMLNTHPT